MHPHRLLPLPLLTLLAGLLMTTTSPAATPDPLLSELKRLATYEAKGPPDVKEVSSKKRGDVTVTELTYPSPLGGPVPALLVHPSGKGPFPAVLFQHWGEGSKSEFLDEAVSLAHSGVVSLLIDAPFVRPDPWRKPMMGPQMPDTWKQALVDLRRGVDVLTARPEVDGKRLAYVGHSFGTSLGGALAGVEPRLSAFVIMSGLGDFSEVMRTGPGPIETARKNTPPDLYEAFLKALAPIDGIVGIRNSSAAFFFQYPRADQAVPFDSMRRYFEAAPQAKFLKTYEGGHELNEAARRDRAQWLRTMLGFGELPTLGLPMIAESPITSPTFKAIHPPEFTKLRPVLTVPGMEEIDVRKDIVYKRVGTQELKLDIYIPEVAKRRTVPVVMMAHGMVPPNLAPFLKDTTAFINEARWLAAHGLIVVLPEIGSPIRGPQPSQWFTGVPDVAANFQDAIAFIRREAATYRIDPEKVAVMTFSGGGLWGLTPALKDPSPWLKCAVAWYPLLGTQPAQPPELDPLELLRKTQKPVPMLLVRAGRDMPQLNALLDTFVKEARSRTAPLTLIELPEAQHAFEFLDDVESSRDTMRRTAAFLNEHLGP